MNTLPMLPFRLGYLKFQVAFLYPTYRLLFGVCRVCAAGAHAVARYAKLPVLFQPRACILHTPYALQMGRLPEIHSSGSLLIRQDVGWIDKPNISHFYLLGYACG